MRLHLGSEPWHGDSAPRTWRPRARLAGVSVRHSSMPQGLDHPASTRWPDGLGQRAMA